MLATRMSFTATKGESVVLRNVNNVTGNELNELVPSEDMAVEFSGSFGATASVELYEKGY